MTMFWSKFRCNYSKTVSPFSDGSLLYFLISQIDEF